MPIRTTSEKQTNLLAKIGKRCVIRLTMTDFDAADKAGKLDSEAVSGKSTSVEENRKDVFKQLTQLNDNEPTFSIGNDSPIITKLSADNDI